MRRRTADLLLGVPRGVKDHDVPYFEAGWWGRHVDVPADRQSGLHRAAWNTVGPYQRRCGRDHRRVGLHDGDIRGRTSPAATRTSEAITATLRFVRARLPAPKFLLESTFWSTPTASEV